MNSLVKANFDFSEENKNIKLNDIPNTICKYY